VRFQNSRSALCRGDCCYAGGTAYRRARPRFYRSHNRNVTYECRLAHERPLDRLLANHRHVGPREEKRVIQPLTRLDERSFQIVQDTEWGRFVEVHTRKGRLAILTNATKRSDRVEEYYVHMFDHQSAQRVRDALVRVVSSCRIRSKSLPELGV
jgi:hypothetical protein